MYVYISMYIYIDIHTYVKIDQKIRIEFTTPSWSPMASKYTFFCLAIDAWQCVLFMV